MHTVTQQHFDLHAAVYGWLAKSVEMIEKLEPYKLRVGYIKGSGPDLAFNIVVEQGSTKRKHE